MSKIKRIQLSENFWLHEYIPKDLYLKYINKKPHYLIGLLDERLIDADQKLRDKFGATTINNWIDGGDRQWSGIRTPECKYFSFFSQHSYGRVSDKLYAEASADEVRMYIRKDWERLGITSIEEGVPWVHSAIQYILNQTELLIFYPKKKLD